MAEEVRATDAARRKAEELGVELSEIEGSGEHGTILVEDVIGEVGIPSAGVAETIAEAIIGDKADYSRISVEDVGKKLENMSVEALEDMRRLERARKKANDNVSEAHLSSTSTSRRLNVVFSESAYNALKDLADQQGKTISGVVRDAIALQKWFTDTQKSGGRILVEERGRVREILNIR